MAARVGVSPKTLRRLEQGDPSVGLALLIRTLSVLGLMGDIDRIAASDEIGQRLADMRLSQRPRRTGGERRPYRARAALTPQSATDRLNAVREAELNAPDLAQGYSHDCGENLPGDQSLESALVDRFNIPADKAQSSSPYSTSRCPRPS